MYTASVTFTTEKDLRLDGNNEKKEKDYTRVRGICVGEEKNKVLDIIVIRKTGIKQCEVVKEFCEINKIEEQKSMIY